MTHSAKYSFNKNILCHFHLRYAGPIGVEIEHYCIAVTAELWSVTKPHKCWHFPSTSHSLAVNHFGENALQSLLPPWM